MPVACRRCGRAYADAAFEFGRTLWCTCGERVGIEPGVREPAHPGETRFAADAMLGRLARWLRLLGFDCAFAAEIADAELARQAVSERRVVLTRDRRFGQEWWIPEIYLVREEDVRKQLVEVIQKFGLAASIRVLTRCSECNLPLSPVPRAQLTGRVSPKTLALYDAFSECLACERVYWEGSHAARIRALAERLASPG